MEDWQLTATFENLKRRAEIIAKIRAFFADRGVLEIDTPLVSLTTATDPHLESIQASQVYGGDGRTFFL